MADVPPNQRCDRCRYYRALVRPIQIAGGDYDGRCRRYPPTVLSNSTDSPDITPHVPARGWCGEFVPAEPETIDESAALICRLYLLGDKSAAYGALDKVRELRDTEGGA